jgi:hypothetical protein
LQLPAIGAMISAAVEGALPPDTSQSAVTMMTHLAALPLKHPSAALLFVQILSILLYPLADRAVRDGAHAAMSLLAEDHRAIT